MLPVLRTCSVRIGVRCLPAEGSDGRAQSPAVEVALVAAVSRSCLRRLLHEHARIRRVLQQGAGTTSAIQVPWDRINHFLRAMG